jgi:hypothetical protein
MTQRSKYDIIVSAPNKMAQLAIVENVLDFVAVPAFQFLKENLRSGCKVGMYICGPQYLEVDVDVLAQKVQDEYEYQMRVSAEERRRGA